MRVAIIASPRSGNSWLRVLLAETLGVSESTTHNWREVEGSLPPQCVLQVHWYREPGIQMFLRENGFKIVTIMRHPLDVLLSVLRFCKHDPNNSRWLEGNCDVGCLFNKDITPACPAFLDWCTGFGCENLLSVTYQWLHDPGVASVRYEDLLGNPASTVNGLASLLTGRAMSIPDAALDKYSLPYWQSLPNRHGWQGKAGLWKELFTADSCRAIHERHRLVFNSLGYGIDGANAETCAETISARWKELYADQPGDMMNAAPEPEPAPVNATRGFIASLIARHFST